MNKFTLLLLACIMAVVSCKDNGEDPNDKLPLDSNTLPVEIVIYTGGEPETYAISYLPGTYKIDKIEGGTHGVEKYQYQDDLIEKITYGDVVLGDYVKFEYENKVLVSAVRYEDNAPERKVACSHLTSNALITQSYRYVNNKWEEDNTPVFFEFAPNGNMIKAEGDSGTEINLTYDDKNAPFIHVIGWSKIHFTTGIPFLSDGMGYVDFMGRRNNPLKMSMLGSPDALEYIYDFNDTKNPKFPTKIVGRVNTNVMFTAQISYQ